MRRRNPARDSTHVAAAGLARGTLYGRTIVGCALESPQVLTQFATILARAASTIASIRALGAVELFTTLPRTVPQLFVLNLYERCLKPQSIANTKPGGCATNRKVTETMDWDAVKAWLNR